MPTSRWKPVALAAFLVIYLAGGFFTLIRQVLALPLPFSAQVFMDLGFYENALSRTFSGGNMYAVREIGPAYLYPPPALLFVEVLNLIPERLFRGAIFGALDLLMVALMVYGIMNKYRLGLAQNWYWFPLAFGFTPLLITIELGQINMLTQFGLALMLMYESSAPGWAGFGLGMAIMTKVTPLFFGAYLLAVRNLKTLLWTAASLAVLAALAALRYGIQPFFTYLAVFREMTRVIPVGASGQSLATILARQGVANLGMVQFGLTLYLLMVILLVAYLTFRKGQREPLFIITALAMPLSPNIVWYHHYVFFLLPLLLWMAWRRDSLAVKLWCMAGMLLIQYDYYALSGGLLTHVFGHVSILAVLFNAIKNTTRHSLLVTPSNV
jgi:alpha-1,2-mannosyltransferase